MSALARAPVAKANSLVRRRGTRLALRLALSGVGLLPSVAAAETIHFPHQDARFLYPYQRNGGAALVPDDATAEESLPLVVFLHGTNPTPELHLWFGGGGRDLRPLARQLVRSKEVSPFVLAGPSQSKGAGLARTVWQAFDLTAFVEDVVQATATRVRIDRQRVVLVGHSGAGCNPSGGLAADFWTAGTPLPLALVAIDPCLDAKLGQAFARRPAGVPLWLSWQPALWVREPNEFAAALARDKPELRVDRVVELPPRGPNPHEAIVPIAFESAMRELFGVKPAE